MVNLQERILGVLEEHGPIPARDVPRYLSDVDNIALDCGLNALMRANKVSLALGRYSRVAPPEKKSAAIAKPIAQAVIAEVPPIAAEEVAASLQPATWVCETCGPPAQPECEFRAIGPGRKRSKVCNSCHGKKISAGQTKHRGQAAEAPEQVNSKSPRERGDNRDVSTERSHKAAAVPETSGSYSRSDPREEARTPASPELASPRIGDSIATPGATLTGEPSPSSVAEGSRPRELRPVIADRVFELAQAKRATALNRIAVLEVDLANQRSTITECDTFLEMYARFAQEGTV